MSDVHQIFRHRSCSRVARTLLSEREGSSPKAAEPGVNLDISQSNVRTFTPPTECISPAYNICSRTVDHQTQEHTHMLFYRSFTPFVWLRKGLAPGCQPGSLHFCATYRLDGAFRVTNLQLLHIPGLLAYFTLALVLCGSFLRRKVNVERPLIRYKTADCSINCLPVCIIQAGSKTFTPM